MTTTCATCEGEGRRGGSGVGADYGGDDVGDYDVGDDGGDDGGYSYSCILLPPLATGLTRTSAAAAVEQTGAGGADATACTTSCSTFSCLIAMYDEADRLPMGPHRDVFDQGPAHEESSRLNLEHTCSACPVSSVVITVVVAEVVVFAAAVVVRL
jgi:hypothetical protein